MALNNEAGEKKLWKYQIAILVLEPAIIMLLL